VTRSLWVPWLVCVGHVPGNHPFSVALLPHRDFFVGPDLGLRIAGSTLPKNDGRECHCAKVWNRIHHGASRYHLNAELYALLQHGAFHWPAMLFPCSHHRDLGWQQLVRRLLRDEEERSVRKVSVSFERIAERLEAVLESATNHKQQHVEASRLDPSGNERSDWFSMPFLRKQIVGRKLPVAKVGRRVLIRDGTLPVLPWRKTIAVILTCENLVHVAETCHAFYLLRQQVMPHRSSGTCGIRRMSKASKADFFTA
jgi:hypothetical protein